MAQPLSAEALAQLFTDARTMNDWQDTPVSDDQITALYDLVKMGPTSANCCPARFYFVKSDAAKAWLLPHVGDGNKAKVEAAPVTVIIGNDMSFADNLDRLFPHEPDAKNWFAAPAVKEATAMRNATLQGGYFIMAARSLGLDCGPMSGFDQAGVDAAFFADTNIKSNFICAIGYGDATSVYPRSPRLPFDMAAKIL